MSIITKGNPYTHYEETRESIPNKSKHEHCWWCGNRPKTLYKYYTDNQYYTSPTWFCNKDCYKAFYQ